MSSVTFSFDGCDFDLSRTWVDTLGVCWQWTGRFDGRDIPLMQALLGDSVDRLVPMDELYLHHGPLEPQEPARARGWADRLRTHGLPPLPRRQKKGVAA